MWLTFAIAIALGVGAYVLWPAPSPEATLPAGWPATVSVIGERSTFAEPYGVAVGADGIIYVSDGVNGNRVHAITPHGYTAVIAGGAEGFADGVGIKARFRSPSGLAVDAAGVIYLADTGNDAIRRIHPNGHVETVATGLNGPVGVAVAADGRVIASDTYNDRLIVVDSTGAVSELPIAGTLDTPTGIAIGADGLLYVADTGNSVVRAIAANGSMTTIDAFEAGGMQRPTAVAVDADGALFVADEDGRVIEVAAPHATGRRARVLAGSSPGYLNGPGQAARFRRLSGVAIRERGHLVVADAGNALLRSVTATALATVAPPPSPFIAPDFDIARFTQTPLLWPLEPLGGPFEIAGTIGEARGADAGRFHAGIDVRADNGSAVLAVREGAVSAPLATGSFGTLNEWLRLGELGYVHLRVGRTLDGTVLDDRFVPTRDERGRVSRMRVKRGARFQTGEVIGSVNQFNHVHLNVGWSGEEYNPLLFRLVQFEDTIPPTIAPGGIRLFDAADAPVDTRVRGRVQVAGAVRIVVDAWDQANGNRPNRRLGVYSLGYQLLHPDGRPVAGFETPLETIRFDRLVSDPDAARLVYAPGSGIPFYGERRTRFLYIVTNTFRGGVAAPGMWDTGQIQPGDYILRVRVADINGNEAVARRDLQVTITGRELPTGG
jgi:streptogramin lyase